MKLHVYSAIKKYAEKNPLRLHMPSHNSRGEFVSLYNDAVFDVTEQKFIDNERAVSLAEKDVAKILGAKKSFLLSDGATSGVLIMAGVLSRFGKKVIISSSSHKSVYNGLKLFGLTPLILSEKTAFDLSDLPDADEIERILKTEKDVAGALLTYPDYYGRRFDIKRVSETIKNHGRLFAVDGSHGGHYAFTDGLKYAGEYADIWVDSAHKTFPSLNQGAILNLGNESLIEPAWEYKNVFTTTSPSYLILSSVEYGVKYMQETGRNKIKSFSKKIFSSVDKLNAVGLKTECFGDFLKVSLVLNNLTDKAQAFFENENVFAEMNDGNRLLFMFSPSLSENDADRFVALAKRFYAENEEAIKNAYYGDDKITVKANGVCEKSEMAETFAVKEKTARQTESHEASHTVKSEALNSLDGEYVPLCEAIGRICCESAGSFPPCFPIINSGETVTEIAVAKLLASDFTFGIMDGKIKVKKQNK